MIEFVWDSGSGADRVVSDFFKFLFLFGAKLKFFKFFFELEIFDKLRLAEFGQFF